MMGLSKWHGTHITPVVFYWMFIPDVLVQLLLRWFLYSALFVFTLECSVTVVLSVYMGSKMTLLYSTVVTLGTFELLFLGVCSIVFFKIFPYISKVTTIHTLVVPYTLVYIPNMTSKVLFTSISLITLRALMNLVRFNGKIMFLFYCRTPVVEEFSLSGKDSPTVISFTMKLRLWKKQQCYTRHSGD